MKTLALCILALVGAGCSSSRKAVTESHADEARQLVALSHKVAVADCNLELEEPRIIVTAPDSLGRTVEIRARKAVVRGQAELAAADSSAFQSHATQANKRQEESERSPRHFSLILWIIAAVIAAWVFRSRRTA